MWAGEDGGEDTEVAGGQNTLGGLGGLHHWMALMAEHMAQDSSRLPFLWPKVSTGKTATPTQRARITSNIVFSLSFCLTK